MAKITIPPVSGGFDLKTTVDARFQQVEDELNNKVLYKTNPIGEDNSLDNDIDMDGYDLLNIGTVNAAQVLVDGVDIEALSDAAVAAAAEAEASAITATESATAGGSTLLVMNYQSIRDYAGAEQTFYARGGTTAGDGGEAFFQKKTGAGVGFYIDNADTVLVPTGGDGTEGWVRAVEVYKFSTVAEMITSKTLLVGNTIQLENYTSTNNSGTMFGSVVAAGTGTVDGLQYIDLPNTSPATQFVQDVPNNPSAKLAGAEGDGTTDDRASLAAVDAIGNFTLTSGNYKLVSSITFTNTVSFLAGASLTVPTAITAGFTKEPIAGDYEQLFYGVGNVTGLSSPSLDWFAGSLKGTTTPVSDRVSKALEACVTSGILRINTGTYYLDNTNMNVLKGQNVLGAGSNKSLFLYSTSNTGGFVLATEAYAAISGIGFRIADTTAIPASGTCISISSVLAKVKDIVFNNTYNGIDISAGLGATIESITALDTLRLPFFIHDCADVYLSNFTFAATSTFFDITPTAGVLVAGETITGGTSGATGTLNVILIAGTRVKVVESNINFTPGEVITGTTSGATATADTLTRPHQLGAIRMQEQVEAFICQQGDIVGGVFAMTSEATSYTVFNRPAYNHFTDVYFDSADSGVSLNKCVATRFTGCWFSNRPGNGIDVLATNDDISFSNCSFINSWQNGALVHTGATGVRFQGCTFAGNNASGGAYDGVQFQVNTDFSVQGCRSGGTLGFGTQRYGVHVNAGASDRYIIADNLVSANGTAGVQDGGTGVGKRVANNY